MINGSQSFILAIFRPWLFGFESVCSSSIFELQFVLAHLIFADSTFEDRTWPQSGSASLECHPEILGSDPRHLLP